MASIEKVFNEKIRKTARREINAVVGPLKKDVAELKRQVAQLKRQVASLQKEVPALVKDLQERKKVETPTEAELEKARLSPMLIKKLRKRLGLTQGELAQLVDVSLNSVGLWEKGATAPTGDNRARLIGLRGKGRREVRKILETIN